MSKPALQPDRDPPFSKRPFEAPAGEVTTRRLSVAGPGRADAQHRLLHATIDENRTLTTRVRELEADLQNAAAEVARLRGELRGAVQEALTDPLTRLANRRSFDLELRAVAARTSGSSSAHLALIDIDHFKRVNDAHGHDVGDEVLRIVAEVLRANVRRDSLVARLGGDEFGLLLPQACLRYAEGIASRTGKLLASRPLVLRGQPEVMERITLSIGLAGCRAGESGATWYARADAALYRAKRGGRNRTSIAAMAAPEP